MISSGMSGRMDSPIAAHFSGKTSSSPAPEKSSTASRANSAPLFFETCRLTAVTTTASEMGSGVHPPSCATPWVARSSASVRKGSSGCPET